MSQSATDVAAVTEDAQARQQIVQTAIEQVTHIATLPEITLRIVDVVDDPESTANDLHQIIANDPALCARVLKVVNSSFYGLPGQIGSINRAIVLLGMNAVKNIAVAASLAKLFRGGELCHAFSARDLWSHSMATAAAARLLAEKVTSNVGDEAFLAGLIHDIGIMVEMQAFRRKLVDVFDLMDDSGVNFLEAEEQVIGANHQDFGRGLCERWKFPKSFTFVTGYHHRPLDLAPEQRGLTSVIYVADILAAQGEFGYCGTVDRCDPDPQVLKDLGLSAADVAQVAEALPEAYEVADQLMN
ncbi:MAG: HDOD domain-containing protein [Phycisphaerae bacterium]|nr:HDOD domain-containing protein [Phycisphaerae bacterium]